MPGGIRECRGCIGAGRDCRYSDRRGIDGIRGHWGFLGGVEGYYWGVRASGCRGVSGVLGLTGSVGTQGSEGV